jgi:hypothetical protein
MLRKFRAKHRLPVVEAAGATLLGLYALAPGMVRAVDVVSFSSSDVGSTHAIGEWGH